MALKNDSSVVALGANDYGQTDVPIAAQSGVTAIAAGESHTVALKHDGTVVAWGDNSAGQVTGTPTTNGYPNSATASPVTLNGQVLSGVTAIAAGGGLSVALKNYGSVVVWGSNNEGQTTVPVAAQSGVKAIAAGGRHIVALKNDGTVVAWGWNYYGQVTGTQTTSYPYSATASPVTLEGQVLSGVTAIAAGYRHTLALKSDGSVVAWAGYGPGPVTLGGQVLNGVTAIAGGGWHTVALIGGVPLLPFLNARTSGNELILSWPTNAVGFTLQSAPNLTAPLSWIDSTAPRVVIGTQFTVTNSTSGSGQFYRLRKL